MSAELSLQTLWALALAGVRLVALFTAAPVFSHRTVPVRLRVSLALFTTWACAPQVVSLATPRGDEPVAIAVAVAGEVLVGASLGFAMRLIFAAFGLLGEFISVQGGLGAASVLDPTSGSSSMVLTSLMQFVGLTIFLAVDGHHALLQALVASFASLPPGAAWPDAERFASVVALGRTLFEVAVRLAAPVTVVMLVSNVTVGILGRAIPQLNLIALQLPAHIAVTLLVIGLGAGALTRSMAEFLDGFTDTAVRSVLGGG